MWLLTFNMLCFCFEGGGPTSSYILVQEGFFCMSILEVVVVQRAIYLIGLKNILFSSLLVDKS